MEDRYEIDFPFTIEEGGGGISQEKYKYWRPGTYKDCDNEYAAHGVGRQIFYVIDCLKPKSHQTRVFYRMEYIDPNGKLFRKKSNLKCMSIGWFKNKIKGYPYPMIWHSILHDEEIGDVISFSEVHV